MLLRQLFDGETSTYTYLVADESTRDALLIDPVREKLGRDLELVEELNLTLRYALDTHVHADHVTAAGALRARTGCGIVASAAGPESANIRVRDGDHLRLGAIEVEVIGTPGHTDDSVTYRIGDNLFTGDALLVRGCGRTDFQNGSAEQLYDSLTRRIFSLPDETRVWPGHDYRGHTVSSVGEEKRFNARLAGRSRDEFARIMNALALPRPQRIDEAVPANREVGLGMAQDSAEGGFRECDAARARASLRTTRVIDVREPHEFAGELGHIEGAENRPMARFPDVATGWKRTDPLLVVCRSGRRSREVCQMLARLGFEDVANLSGGMLEWRASESP
jgi:glyoxylase-like metal-dependent hydrolase (beta-lactamase superfamily II)/rhodanese-related sulfurtransferase